MLACIMLAVTILFLATYAGSGFEFLREIRLLFTSWDRLLTIYREDT
jgi:hypothetical protein